MREILFRGKRVDSGEWLYGYLIQFKLVDETISYIFNTDVDINMKKLKINIQQQLEQVVTDTVGQFTGLTDKNGTKIFEGDIVQYFNGTPAHIMFLQGGFIIVGEGFRNEFIGHAVAHIEVVGNIHEKGETNESNKR